MSGLGGFLFGNIDEEGRLDNEDFDEELRANLTTFSERIQDRKLLLEGGFLAEDLIEEFSTGEQQPKPSNFTGSSAQAKGPAVAPLPDAENFEDINELAEAIGTEKPLVDEPVLESQPVGLIEPLNIAVTEEFELDKENYSMMQFDTRQILKFTRLSAKPALLNATGRSYSRYAALRKLRLKRKQLLHGKGTFSSVENQLETFLAKSGPSTVPPSAASSRLRLSLVNLSGTTAAMAPIKTTKKPWLQSARFHDLEKSLQRIRSQAQTLAMPAESANVKIPDNSHFHPLALLEWEKEIIWDTENTESSSTASSKGMFVSLNTQNQGPTSTVQPTVSSATPGSSQSPSLNTNAAASGVSLSSILSSLSLSNGALGDSASSSATATALLALIRNQQMRSASLSTGSVATSIATGRPQMSRSASNANAATAATVKLKYPKAPAARVINKEFETGDWTDSIIWEVNEETDPSKLKTHLILPLDDPELIFTPLPVENLSKKLGRAEKLIAKRLKKLQTNSTAISNFSKPILDKFNLSNDKYYELSGGNEADSNSTNSSAQRAAKVVQEQVSSKTISSRSSVSPTFLGLHHSVPALQHSVPALKLAPPAFQTCRTKRELRLWHRPRLPIPSGFTIQSWLKVKSPSAVIKKGANQTRVSETSGSLTLSITCNPSGGIIRSAKKLTLKDSSRFVLLEYFEEFPPLLMNPGMGAYIVLYYRKRSPQDTFIPRSTFALVQVLDFTDPSPFMMFGDVPAGCSRYALCNGLFRAPLFPHKAANSDFIVSRHAHNNDDFDTPGASTLAEPHAEFYLRPLESAPVLLVGQEFPLVEVPGPHSRRHNLFCRQRLQVAAYRLFNKDLLLPDSGHSRRRLKIGRLLTAFPQFSEGSIRKWLKDYAESTRAGKDSGVWLLKDDAPQLDEDELRALVTPEAICQYESMMAEQQRLADAEILLYDPFNTTEIEDEELLEDDESSAAANAKKATTSKRSKELGELNQAAPWNTTANFLGAVAGRCTLKLRGYGDPSGRGEAFSFVKAPGEKGTSSAVANSAGSEYRQDISRIWESHINSLSGGVVGTGVVITSNTGVSTVVSTNTTPPLIPTELPNGAKLVISRRFGSDQWITEEITDPLIIRAYLRIRKQASASTSADKKLRRGFVAPDSLPTLSASDAAPLSNGQSKKSASTGNKSKAKSVIKTSPTVSAISTSSEKNLQIKCGACGQVGHMRTNRICPLFTLNSTEISTKTTTAATPPVKLKLKFTTSSTSTSSTVAANQIDSFNFNLSNDSNESIYPSPVLIPVSHRPKGPPIEPLQSNRKRPRRKLTPKQLHAQFLSRQSVQVKSQLAALSTILISIVDGLILLPTTLAFHKPVPRKLYPLYYKLIKNPIDLSSIRAKAVALMYKSSTDFHADFLLLATNCETFNGKDAPLSDVARDMLARVQNQLNESEQVKEADNFLKENISDGDDGNVTIDQGDDVSIMTDQEGEGEGEDKDNDEEDVEDTIVEDSVIEDTEKAGVVDENVVSEHADDPGNQE